MLWHLVNHGDENIALYKVSDRTCIPADVSEREKHKYDLYSRFDQIVFNENVIEIGNDNNGGTIDIDWSQIDTSNFTVESAE
jgi:hypothetical protein